MLPSTKTRLSNENDQKGVVVYHSQKHSTSVGCGPTDPAVTIEIRDSNEVYRCWLIKELLNDALTICFECLEKDGQ